LVGASVAAIAIQVSDWGHMNLVISQPIMATGRGGDWNNGGRSMGSGS